jgi:hypothetical protein
MLKPLYMNGAKYLAYILAHYFQNSPLLYRAITKLTHTLYEKIMGVRTTKFLQQNPSRLHQIRTQQMFHTDGQYAEAPTVQRKANPNTVSYPELIKVQNFKCYVEFKWVQPS